MSIPNNNDLEKMKDVIKKLPDKFNREWFSVYPYDYEVPPREEERYFVSIFRQDQFDFSGMKSYPDLGAVWNDQGLTTKELADYVATFNPKVILDLVNRVEKLQRELGLLLDSSKNYLELPPQVKGEGLRDLRGTIAMIEEKGDDYLEGWALLYQKWKTKNQNLNKTLMDCYDVLTRPFTPEPCKQALERIEKELGDKIRK